MTPEKLLHDYNHWRSLTAFEKSKREENKWSAPLKANPKNLAQLQAMHEFCLANNLDTRLWLYKLFTNRYWTYCPKLDQLFSKNAKTNARNFEKYRKTHDLAAYRSYIEAEKRTREVSGGTNYNPARDIGSSTEALKSRILLESDPHVCMNRFENTLGYHPKSKVCEGCGVKDICAAALKARCKYDVLGLRRGDITWETARQQEAYHNGY